MDLGIELAERTPLQLDLHPVDAEPVRERRVDLEGLLRDAAPGVLSHVLERAHVVQPIRELDQDHADVFRHREQHLPEVLRLVLRTTRELDLADLGETCDEVPDFLSKLIAQLLLGGQRVLDGVVQESGRDRDRIQAHLRQDLRDRERVGQVGLARQAHLALVNLRRVDVAPLQEARVNAREVLLDSLFDLADSRHSGTGYAASSSHPKSMSLWSGSTLSRSNRQAAMMCTKSLTACSMSALTTT